MNILNRWKDKKGVKMGVNKLMTTISTTQGNYYRNPQKSVSSKHIAKVVEKSSPNVWTDYFLHELKAQQAKLKNIQKIKTFNTFINDSGEPFNQDVIDIAQNIVHNLVIQPEVFPTGRHSIQLEYEKTNGDYLEFEIFYDRIEMLFMDQDEREREETFHHSEVKEMNQRVRDFYEGTLRV